jgi:hypothetical protein
VAVLTATVTLTGTTLAVGIAASAPASAATVAATPAASSGTGTNSGTVTGEAFRDYNANGQMDTAVTTTTATDIGVAGVTVTAYDSTDAVVGTTTTASNGSYTLSFSASASTQVRIQFGIPSYLSVGPDGTGTSGVQSGGQVQFVSSGGTANLGLVAPGDYCGANPTITVPCQQAVVPNNDSGATSPSAPALYSLSSTATGDSPGQVTQATIGQVGSISGNAVYTSPNGTAWDLTAAYFKEGAALGPSGLGAIYLTQLGTGTPNGSTFTVVPNVGTDPRPTENPSSTTYNWFHDTSAFSSVGRIGLGQLMLSADQTTLYATDLYNNTIVAIPLSAPTTAGGPPTAGTPVSIPLPTSLPGAAQGCTTANLHGFGLGQYNGVLYAALTCTGPAVANLRSYVYSMNESTDAFASAPSIEIPLTFTRGCTLTNSDGCVQGTANIPPRSSGGSASSAAWNPWTDTGTAGFTLSQFESGQRNSTVLSYPMPDLASITFTSNGSMQLAFHDRLGDMSGENLGDPTTTTGSTAYSGRDAGDELLACGNPSSGWTLEQNGSCGGVAGSGVGNNAGPGGGEFYVHYFNGSNTNDTGGTSHQHTAMGSALQVPGFADVVTTDYDPTDGYGSGGLRAEANANGANVSGAQLYSSGGTASNFSKSSGLGEISSLCGNPPVEIGDRVWIDSNDNGIQDPGELPVAGATVTLSTTSGTQLASTVTNSSGVYTFSSTTIPTLSPSTQYVVAVTRAADFATGGVLAGAIPTKANIGADNTVTSKGIAVTGTGAVGATYTVTSPAVGANLNADFGFVVPGSLTGTAYVDKNLNGSYDSGETAVAGVTATLETLAGGPVTDVNGATVAAVTTSSTGAYAFTNLVPGNYEVVFSTIPSGDVLVNPSSGTSPSTAVPGGGVGVANVGVTTAPGSITGEEYVDGNRNGNLDAGEAAVTSPVTVTLTNGGASVNGTNGAVIGPITTTTGTYSFANVPPGSGYVVSFTGPSGDSFVSPTGGISGSLTVTTGAATVQNAGVTPSPGTISGEEYVDTNRNKTLDPGEPAVTGSITVTLTNGGSSVVGTNGTPIAPITTSSGSYSFANVPPGSGYVVTFTEPSGDSFVSPTGGISGSLTVATGVNTVQNQGVTASPGSITGEEYVDTNRNGVLDTGESAVTGSVTVTLTNGGSSVVGTNGTTIGPITNTNGTYSFANVPPGSGYVVTFTDPSGYSFVSPAAGVSGSLTVTTGAATVQNQGVTASPGTISGEEYVDTNLNKTLDSGDTPVTSSVTVTLTNGGSPVVGTNGMAIAPVTTTNGTYSFANVPPGGGYVVTFTDPSGDSFVSPAAGVSGSLTVTTGVTTVQNQGVTVSPGTIAGEEYVDTNRNGTLDTGESAVTSSVTVTLTNGGKSVTGTDGNPIGQVTTTSGAYTFANVPPGSGYVVTFTDPMGDVFTSPTNGISGSLTVATGATTTQNAGVTTAPNTVSGEEYVDLNRNGTLDSGEPAVSGSITVTLTKNGSQVTGTNGVVIQPVTTTTGSYSFPNVPPDTGYTVTFTEPSGDTFVSPAGGTVTFAVPTNTAGVVENAGVTAAPGTISGTEYFDTNLNGAFDSGEAPVATQITATLRDGNGNPVVGTDGVTIAPVTTTNGTYSFPTVPPGNGYTVTFTKPAADVFVTPPTGTSGPLTVNSGVTVTQNQGVTAPPGTISGTEYVDTNLDNSLDNGESGVTGPVTVTLENSTGGSVQGTNAVVIAPVSTTNGTYSFANVPPGNGYQVVFTDPNGYVFVTPAGGKTSSVAVTANTNTVVNQGVTTAPGTVSGTEYVDSNLNGSFDQGEPAVSGTVIVRLRNASNNQATGTNGQPIPAVTTTDGTYSFANVPPGSGYTVSFTDPSGYVFVSPATGTSPAFSVTTGQNTEEDQGVTPAPGTISGEEFVDTNKNGILDSGETGVTSSVTVTLTKGGAQVQGTNGAPITAVTTTNGSYTFANVPPGSGYVVTFTLPNGDTFTGTTAGISGSLTVTGGATTTQNQGVTAGPGTIAGTEYVDTNLDGSLDNGEAAVTGSIVVRLRDSANNPVVGTNGTTIASITTTNGSYSFTNVPPGTGYTVTFTEPSSDTFVSPAGGISGPLTVTTGNTTTQNQGVTASPGSISGTEYVDGNLDGFLDNGESAVTGQITVTLKTAAGGGVTGTNGVAIAPVTTTTGTYSFANVPPGSYQVVFTDPSGEVFVSPAGGLATGVTVNTNANTVQNQGVTAAPGTISGEEYNDNDLSQTLDNGDTPVTSSVTATLTNGGNPVVGTNGATIAPVTTTNGSYSFANVPPGGGYVVTFTKPAADSFVNPANGISPMLTVNTNANTVQNQGVTPAPTTISGEEYVDTNRNGTLDTGEPAVTSGIMVSLSLPGGGTVTGSDGNPILPITTTTGSYTFSEVPPSASYVVTFTEPSTDTFVSPANGTATVAVPAAGGVVQNAGVTAAPGTITGEEYDDVDLSGTLSAGDTPVAAGLTVTLTNPDGTSVVGTNGTTVAPTTTDANGTYSFSNVPPGSYTVTFTAPGGDSFVVPAGGMATGVPVSSNTTTTQNAGVTATPGTISGTEYVDSNLSNSYEPGEPVVTDPVTVTLTRTVNGQTTSVTGTGGQALAPITTTNGTYQFTDVPPGGGYVVTFTKPSGDVYVSPANGTSAPLTVTSSANTEQDQGVTASPGTVTGTEYVDTNRDGTLDPGDPGAGPGLGVTLTLPGGGTVTGTNTQPIAPTTTDVNGNYAFTDVPPGTYDVVFTTAPPNDVFTTPAAVAVTVQTNAGAVANAGVTPAPGTISGEEYTDTDLSGTLNGGDVAVAAGLAVTLTNPDGTPVVGTNDTTIAPTTTGANGTYSFGNVPPGSYTVTFTAPSGDSFVIPANGLATGVAVTSGTTTTQNQGVTTTPGSISGEEYVDTNRNNVLDPGESPVTSGVTVTLETSTGGQVQGANGRPIAPTTTDANGAYSFTDVPVGTNYQVVFTAPGGDTFTSTNGGDVTTVAVTTGTTTTVNAGVTTDPGTITGTEYADSNLNGSFDTGEPVVSGVTVRLRDVNNNTVVGTNGVTIAPATTAANGTYTFANVPPGTGYKVIFSAPSGDVFVAPVGGNATGLVVTPNTTTTQNQGVTAGPGTISGEEYVDANDNQTLDPGESPYTAAPITVTLSDGSGNPVIGTDGNPIAPITTSTGTYSFTTVPPGSGYQVAFTTAGTEQFTTPATVTGLRVTTGATTPANAGVELIPGTITGTEYVDTNLDGSLDNGETGVAGAISVRLKDLNNNTLVTATSTNGVYSFTGVAPGTYNLLFSDPSGYVFVSPSTGIDDSIVVNSGGTTIVNQGVTTTPGTITGTEYVDANRNGMLDAGESPVGAGETVTLETSGGGPVTGTDGQPIAATQTAADGTYTFSDVPGGASYQVIFTAPSNDVFVSPAQGDATVAVTSGTTSTVDAGVTTAPGTISGTEYVDANLNKAFDPGEQQVTAGFTVTLVDGNGNQVIGTDGHALLPVTSTSGTYQFTDVPPGSGYVVRFTAPGGDSFVSPTGGTSGALTVNSGSDTVQDQGVTTTPGTISGTEYVDQDLSGTYNSGDTLVASAITATLTLGGQPVLGADGNYIAPVTTSNGTYSFTEVPAGSGYVVSFTDPPGDSFVAPAGGNDSASPLVVNSGATTTQNQGYTAAPGTITGEAYLDSNLNGSLDPGEPAVGQTVTVTLTRNGAPVTGTDARPIAPVTTGTDGTYAFTDVPGGSGYQVSFSEPAGDIWVSPVAGRSGDLTVTTTGTVTQNQGYTAGPGTITGEEYVDGNRDGSLDGTEQAVSGPVTVTLSNGDGTQVIGTNGVAISPVQTTTGTYTFNDVPPGTAYQIRFSQPNGDVFVSPANGLATAVGVTTGTTTTVDAGVTAAPGTISGEEYLDTNRNGTPDNGEGPVTGSPGITVTLTNGTAQVVGTNGQVIAPVTTTTGTYTFADVPPGPGYVVTFTDPAGDVFTSPSTGSSTTLTVQTGVTITQDAGVAPATYGVGDYVFSDTNANGVQDAGDTGLNGVTVQLLGPDGNPATKPDGTTVPSVTTANGPTGQPGYYELGCVLAGNYSVKFTLPANTPPYGFTSAGVGSDPTVDSNPDPTSGIAPVTLGLGDAELTPAGASDTDQCSGGIDRTVDAGVIEPTTVSGILTTTTGSPEGNIQVSLDYATGPQAGTQLPGQLTSTSAADGSYSFTDVPPGGPYEVVFGTLPTGLTYQSPANGTTTPFSVAPGTPVTGENGVVTAAVPTFGVGDTVFDDVNGDGTQDAGDPGVAGATVELVDNSTGTQAVDAFGNLVPTATTGASGHYSFGCVVAGSYTVVFTAPAGSGDVFSQQEVGNNPAGDSNPDPATGKATVQLDATDGNLSTSTTCSGGVDDTVDAGLYHPTSVSGTVATSGGTGLAGITVTLIDPVSKNPVKVGGTNVTAITGASGAYTLSDVPPGSYEVTFGTLPAGDSYQNPSSGTTTAFPVTSGTPVINENAVVGTPPTYGVGNFVWNDLNGNGVQDPGEPGIPGVTVELINSGGTQVGPSATTAADGSYSLGCVPAGTYTVQFTLPSGSTDVTTGADAGSDRTVDSNVSPTATAGVAATQVTLGASDTELTPSATCTGGVDQTIDAGYYQPTSVSGTVETTTGNPVSGITVTLVDPTSGQPVVVGGQKVQATTDSSGDYQLTGVPPGSYQVSFGSLPSGDTYTAPASGVTPAFTVTSGTPVTARDETVAPPATYAVGDFVWDDLNHDGIQQSGEPGVNGVTVQLLNADGTVATGANGSPVPSVVTTTANGSPGFYQLGCVVAGSYLVQFTLPGGYRYTTQGAGTNPALDSNANPAAGATLGQAPVTLGPTDANLSTTAYDPDGCSAGVDPTLDAGIYPIPGTVDGTVKLTGGGTLPAGVTVTASVEDPANGDAVVDGPNGQPLTATVGADGSYSIGDVPPGQYVVGFSGLPAGYSYQTPASGTSAGFDLTPGATVAESATVIAPVAGVGIVSGTISVSGAMASRITGVTVTLEDGTGAVLATAATDANGSYSFPGLTPGTYQVVFGALPAGETYVTPAAGKSGTFTVTAGQVITEGATVTPVVPGTVAGTVTSTGASPDPVPGVTVTLEDASGTPISGVAPATTDANGRYSFTTVPPGSYKVGFTAPAGYQLATPAGGSTAAFTVSSAQTTTENATVTSTAGTIDGTLLDTEGNPVLAGVTVTLDDAAGQPVQVNGQDVTTTTSTTDGTYSFPDVAPGTYEVSFGALPTGDTYVTPASGRSGAVTVAQNGTATQNAVVDVPGGITGKLTDQSGQGIAGVTVTLDDGTGTPVPAVTPVITAADGSYSFPDLPAGTYKVSFGTLPTGDTYVTPSSGTTAALTVTPGATTTADATAQVPVTPGSVSGILEDQNGHGVGGVTVTLKDPDGTVVATTTTAADGSYSFPTVAPGSYQVAFGALPAGDTFVTPASTTVTVASGAAVTADATVKTAAAAAAAGTVSGTVTGSDGAPVAGITVTLLNPDGTPAVGAGGQPVPSTTTAANGTYTFPGVPAGTYQVSFGTPPGGGTYASPATGLTPSFTVTSGANSVENAVLAAPASGSTGTGSGTGTTTTGSGTTGSGTTGSGSTSTGSTGSSSALPTSVPAGLGPVTHPHHHRMLGLAAGLALLGLVAAAFGLLPRRRRRLTR